MNDTVVINTGSNTIPVASTGVQTHQTTTINDEAGSVGVAVGTKPDTKVVSAPKNVEMGDFMKRPVKIHTETWTSSTAASHIDPWALYLNDPHVQPKITQFARLRATLVLEMIINGTPFHQGALLMSYEPCNGSGLSPDIDMVQHSQQPHVILNPTTSQRHSMRLPYTSNRMWIDMTAATGAQVGVLFINVLSVLAMSNGIAPPNPVDITIFAWMEDASMCFPTNIPLATFTPQIYEGNGVISKPASAVAGVANALSNIPFIGLFAKATELVATGIGGAASLFGFSNPINLTDPSYARILAMTPAAQTAGSDTATKLSVDPKNELTIDTTHFGTSGADELSLSYLKSIPSYVGQFGWDEADVAGSILGTFPVTPAMFAQITPSFEASVTGAISEMFQTWTGTMKFHFQVVCSQYHRGRIRVTYIPGVYSAGNFDPDEYNVNYTQIYDIQSETNYTFTVGWTARDNWLRCDNPAIFTTTFDPLHHNGTIVVSVVNALVAPAATCDAPILIWVSGGDDLQFAIPRDIDQSLQYVSPTIKLAGIDDNDEETESVVALVPTLPRDGLNILAMGEAIVSLRTLLKRTSFWGLVPTQTGVTNGANTDNRVWVLMPRYPLQPGQVPAATTYWWHRTATAANYNYTKMIPLTFIIPWFLGTRGSLRHRFAVRSLKPPETGSGNTNMTNVQYYVTRWDYNTGNYIAAAGILGSLGNTTNSQISGIMTYGVAATNIVVNNFASGGVWANPTLGYLEVELPDYNPIMYHVNGGEVIQSGEIQSGCVFIMDFQTDSGTAFSMNHAPSCMVGTAIGEDFTTVFFTGIPRYYKRAADVSSSTTYVLTTTPTLFT